MTPERPADPDPGGCSPAPGESFFHRTEDHYRVLFECAPEAYFLVDLKGVFLDGNRAAEALIGYPRQELIGKTFMESGLMTPDQIKIALKLLAQNAAGIRPAPGELRVRRKDCREMLVEIHTLPVQVAGRTLVLSTARDITAQRQAEERLRRSEASLRLAQRIGCVGSWEVEIAADVLQWSEETFRIFGCDPASFQPTNAGFFAFVHPEDRARVQQASRAAIRRGAPYQIEHRIVRPDGSERFLSEQADILLDEHGKPARLVGIVQDITDRKLMEERLRESEEHYRRLIHTCPDGITLTDPAGRITFASPRMFEIFGLSPEVSVLGQSVLNWVAPEQREPARRTIQQLLAGKQPGTPREYRLLKADRSPFWGELCSTPLLDAQGAVKGMMSICRDITQRKQTEARLAEQAALLEAANDAIMVRDLEHRIRYWNKAAERLYGWTAAEAMDKQVSDLLDRDLDQFEKACRQVLDQGDWSGEVRQISKAGRPVIVLSRWTLVRDERGHPKSIFVINTDITERKKLEAQFLRAQRLESIGQLASGIAHDLNNILVPITLVTPVLRGHLKDPEMLGLLDTVEASAQRGANIVKQVLTFSRGIQSAKTSTPTRQLLEEIANIIRETFPRSITLKASWPEDLWSVYGDATQLHQVLMNLSVNARDAMPEGGVLTLSAENVLVDELFASTVPNAKPGPHIVWLVADSGVGIPPEHLDQIFDPFFTTKEVGEGTGLGLSTVLGIVRNHEGFIRVDSKVGRGTQFQVYLPALAQADPQLTQPVQEPPKGRGELVLVVDDEENIRTVTRRVLERHNYQVLVASEGAEAVMLVTQHLNSLRAVLTDLMMPQMGGLTLIRILQRLAPNVKILVATGLDTSAQLNTLTQLGIKTVLRKPFPPAILLQQLRLELDR